MRWGKALAAAALVAVAAWLLLGFSRYRPPRTSFGDPDLQGLWTNVSRTQLERKKPGPLVISEQSAKKVEKKFQQFFEDAYFFEDHAPPEIIPDATLKKGKGARRAMLGYNSFWWDIDAPFSRVHGEIRSSWIVDPPDGKVPYTAAALAEMKKALTIQSSKDGPEFRRLGERCLLGFGSTSGPPMLNVEYNNHYRIVQAPGYVAILVEMVHDVRIIPIGGKPLPAGMTPWMGDSIGRWDGNTLVVETRNRHPL